MSIATQILFVLCAITAMGGAVATVASKRPLRAAMGLLVHIIALAGLFLSLQAEMLAAIQLLVYAGAVVVLFVFVIMLIGPSAVASNHGRGLSLRAVSGSLMAMVTLAVASSFLHWSPAKGLIGRCTGEAGCLQFGGVDGVGRGDLFGRDRAL